MQGELLSVWSETRRELWSPLIDSEQVGSDIFCELYRTIAPALARKLTIEELADLIDSPEQSREAFERISESDIESEILLLSCFEEMHFTLEEFGGDALSNLYFNLLSRFTQKFNLRYDLRRPCTLCPTVPGIFNSLVGQLQNYAHRDEHLAPLLHDFEESVRDLRHGCTEGRIRTCLGKQFMLLEALGASAPDITKKTLGDICDEITNWPHATVRDSLKKLYGFSSDYPGIRHGGSASGKLRDIGMRDLVAMSIMLTGFTPYLSPQLSPDALYGVGN